MAKISRNSVRVPAVDFSLASVVTELPANDANAGVVALTVVQGAWASGTASVKFRAGNDPTPFDFSTPKTIAAGGGYIQISEGEMRGVTSIVVVGPSTAPSCLVNIDASFDVEA